VPFIGCRPIARHTFKDNIEAIRKGIDGLEKLPAYKLPKRPETILDQITSSPSDKDRFKNTQRALQRLHEALASQASKKILYSSPLNLTKNAKGTCSN